MSTLTKNNHHTLLLKDAVYEIEKLVSEFSDIVYGDKHALKISFISKAIDPAYIGEIPYSVFSINDNIQLPSIYMQFVHNLQGDISMLKKMKGTDSFNIWVRNTLRDILLVSLFQTSFMVRILRTDPAYSHIAYKYLNRRDKYDTFKSTEFVYAVKWSMIDPVMDTVENKLRNTNTFINLSDAQKLIDTANKGFEEFVRDPDSKVHLFKEWSFTISDAILLLRKEAYDLKTLGVLKDFRYAVLVTKQWFDNALIPLLDNYKLYKLVKQFDNAYSIYDKSSIFWQTVLLVEQIERHLFAHIIKKNIDSETYKRFIAPIKHQLTEIVSKIDSLSIRSITHGQENNGSKVYLLDLMNDANQKFSYLMAKRLVLYANRTINEEKSI